MRCLQCLTLRHNYCVGCSGCSLQQKRECIRSIIRMLYLTSSSTYDLHKRPCLGLLTSADNIKLLRPDEITDTELYVDGVLPDLTWHGNHVSYIPGLNKLSDLFIQWRSSQQRDQCTSHDLLVHMNAVRLILDHLPPELKWRGRLSRPQGSNFGTDVQTANLYITQLHIRCNLLDQIVNISRAAPSSGITTPEVICERQSVVDDMLEILRNMPPAILQANGYSLMNKIRDIGSELLNPVMGDGMDNTSPRPRKELLELLSLLDVLQKQD